MKDDFATVKKLVFVILGAIALSSSGWGITALAANEKTNALDNRITAVETNQANILNNQEDQKQLTQQLINLTTQTNLLVQTHIARSHD